MKKQLFILLSAFTVGSAMSQKAWVEPDPINPNDSITVWVDLNKCADFGGPVMAGTTDDLYMWTWSPREHAVGHPLHNGTWGASNEALKLQKAGNGLVYYRMIPTSFYEVTAAQVYGSPIKLLVKKKNGSDDCGGQECKTEDLEIKIEAPKTGPKKLYSFPGLKTKDTLSITPNDVITIFYDNNLETTDSLKGRNDFYCIVKARIGTGVEEFAFYVDGDNIKAADRDIAGKLPQMKMKDYGNGKFGFSFIPNKLMAGANTQGKQILSIKYKIVRGYIRKQYDWVAESPEYWFNTVCQ